MIIDCLSSLLNAKANRLLPPTVFQILRFMLQIQTTKVYLKSAFQTNGLFKINKRQLL